MNAAWRVAAGLAFVAAIVGSAYMTGRILDASVRASATEDRFTVRTTPPDDYGVVCYVLDPNTGRQVMSCVKVQGSALPPGAQWLDPHPKTRS